MNLFLKEDFISHAGLPLTWKVECDALTKKDYENYYNGYCNEVLWPIFHYRLDLVDYSKLFYLRCQS